MVCHGNEMMPKDVFVHSSLYCKEQLEVVAAIHFQDLLQSYSGLQGFDDSMEELL